jgi:hypothetical protein
MAEEEPVEKITNFPPKRVFALREALKDVGVPNPLKLAQMVDEVLIPLVDTDNKNQKKS